MEWKLREAAYDGNYKETRRILKENPEVNVNSNDALYWACMKGHHKIVSLLLAHPDIDVNKGSYDQKPFLGACSQGRTSCVHLLLADSRVNLEIDDGKFFPAYLAARDGHIDVIKWWIASGREVHLGKPGDAHNTDAIGGAMLFKKIEVVSLLERLQDNPDEKERRPRREDD